MSTLSGYQRELSLPLILGIHEDPPWTTFMRTLVNQTYARRAFLVITLANAMASQEPAVVHVAAGRAAHEPPLDFMRIAAMGLNPYGLMRPGRVYALEEMLDHSNAAQRDQQREALNIMGIHYGRWLRISAPCFADAWMLLVREREDFSSFASSLLSSIIPHFAAALQTFVALSEQRLSSAMAHRALERSGIGQLAFDSNARVIAADPLAETLLSFLPEPGAMAGRRLQVRPHVAVALETACAELAGGPADRRRLIRLDIRDGMNMLLRPSDLNLGKFVPRPSVIGTLKIDARDISSRAVQILSELYGLSHNEASLAYGLATGESIGEAGRRLHLTSETARIYSKRVYAKTGTKGQVDLVRMVMAGLAPFA
ncbi:LuxR family transcriptional regulator [Sphingobium sp. AN641]|uniref:helix-turn-helix transcriptional regulator n=1 Tax=Sphingobium sp. AN641 TaxID=3133443 RepID=UPI0030C1D308